MKFLVFLNLIFLALFSAVSAAPVIVTKVVTAATVTVVKNAAEATANAVVVTVTAGAQNKAAAAPTTQAESSSAPASTSSAPKSSSSANSDTSKLGSSSGIGFSQYKDASGCKSEDEIAKSIKALSKYSVIRLYDVDCNLVDVALANKGSDQKLLVNIFHLNNIDVDAQTIVKAVAKNGNNWDAIWGVVVGNEDVNDGTATVDQVESAVSSAQSALKQYGVKVSHVDVYATIWTNTGLCGGDFVAANAHPYFDQSTDPSNCGSWMEAQVAKLKQICGSDKSVIITETGWPTAGDSGRASASNQQKCLASIASSSVADQVILFSAWNEKWKQGTLEQSWGIMGDDPNAS